MAALNISPANVRDALTKNNFLAAVGNTKGSMLQVNLTANTDLHTADQFKQLVVKQDKGTLVRVGDIADVVLGSEDYNTEVGSPERKQCSWVFGFCRTRIPSM